MRFCVAGDSGLGGWRYCSTVLEIYRQYGRAVSLGEWAAMLRPEAVVWPVFALCPFSFICQYFAIPLHVSEMSDLCRKNRVLLSRWTERRDSQRLGWTKCQSDNSDSPGSMTTPSFFLPSIFTTSGRPKRTWRRYLVSCTAGWALR